MANNRIAVLVALEGADDGLKRALNSAQQSLGELATTAKTAGDKAARGMAEVKAGMSAFGEQVSSAKTQLLAFLSINWAAGKVQEIVQVQLQVLTDEAIGPGDQNCAHGFICSS